MSDDITISPKVMIKIGLKSDVAERVKEERQHNITVSRTSGFEVFKQLDGKTPLSKIRLSHGELEIPQVQYPDQLVPNIVKKRKEVQNTPEATSLDLKNQLPAYIEGFGYAAADARSYSVAIVALNSASERGILNNQTALARLVTASKNSPNPDKDLVEIGEILTKIEKNPANYPTLYPQTESMQAPVVPPPEFPADDPRRGAMVEIPADLRPAPLQEQPNPTPTLRPKG